MSSDHDTIPPVARVIPRRVRKSLPDVPSLEDVTRALADECRAYDEAMDRTNAAYTALVERTAKKLVPLWIRFGSICGIVSLCAMSAYMAWHLCSLMGGPCR